MINRNFAFSEGQQGWRGTLGPGHNALPCSVIIECAVAPLSISFRSNVHDYLLRMPLLLPPQP
jgi:hypothetical protein